jgi:hypothetical protein
MARLLIISIFFFYSCGVSKFDYRAGQEYIKEKKDYKYYLRIDTDSTFTFSIKYQDLNPRCQGCWEKGEGDYILLKCNETTEVSDLFSSTYMNTRKIRAEIINRNKIKINNTILRKIKK